MDDSLCIVIHEPQFVKMVVVYIKIRVYFFEKTMQRLTIHTENTYFIKNVFGDIYRELPTMDITKAAINVTFNELAKHMITHGRLTENARFILIQ